MRRVGSKVGHSLASRAGSLLRGTGLNDLSFSLPSRMSFSMRGSLPLLQKCHKILWCPVVDNDLTTVHTCTWAHVRALVGARCTPFSSRAIHSVDAYSMRIMRNVRGTKEFTVETRATTLHFHSREAPREANFACPKSPKIFTTFTFSLPRGQRSSRHLEQSLGVFMVSSSRSRRLVWVTLSLSCSALYAIRASVDNVVAV